VLQAARDRVKALETDKQELLADNHHLTAELEEMRNNANVGEVDDVLRLMVELSENAPPEAGKDPWVEAEWERHGGIIHRLPSLLALKMSIGDLWAKQQRGDLMAQMHTLLSTCEMQKAKLNEQRQLHAGEIRKLEAALEQALNASGGYTEPSLPVKGWLQKQGSEFGANWHPRWVELTRESLSFYEQRGDPRPKRVISLGQIKLVQSSQKRPFGFKLTLVENNEKISLDAEYLENRLNWVWALQYSKAHVRGERLPDSPWAAAGMDGLAPASPRGASEGGGGRGSTSPRRSMSPVPETNAAAAGGQSGGGTGKLIKHSVAMGAREVGLRMDELERDFAKLESNLLQIDANSWAWVEKKVAAQLARQGGSGEASGGRRPVARARYAVAPPGFVPRSNQLTVLPQLPSLPRLGSIATAGGSSRSSLAFAKSSVNLPPVPITPRGSAAGGRSPGREARDIAF